MSECGETNLNALNNIVSECMCENEMKIERNEENNFLFQQSEIRIERESNENPGSYCSCPMYAHQEVFLGATRNNRYHIHHTQRHCPRSARMYPPQHTLENTSSVYSTRYKFYTLYRVRLTHCYYTTARMW